MYMAFTHSFALDSIYMIAYLSNSLNCKFYMARINTFFYIWKIKKKIESHMTMMQWWKSVYAIEQKQLYHARLYAPNLIYTDWNVSLLFALNSKNSDSNRFRCRSIVTMNVSNGSKIFFCSFLMFRCATLFFIICVFLSFAAIFCTLLQFTLLRFTFSISNLNVLFYWCPFSSRTSMCTWLRRKRTEGSFHFIKCSKDIKRNMAYLLRR